MKKFKFRYVYFFDEPTPKQVIDAVAAGEDEEFESEEDDRDLVAAEILEQKYDDFEIYTEGEYIDLAVIDSSGAFGIYRVALSYKVQGVTTKKGDGVLPSCLKTKMN